MSQDQTNTYQTSDTNADHAIACWSFTAKKSCVSRVIPDGCRDFILSKNISTKSPSWFISELSTTAYDVTSRQGEKMQGIRLKPGVHIDQYSLSKWIESHSLNELFILDQIDEFCQQSASLLEALDCLSQEDIYTVPAAALRLGVSIRTLQRLIKKETQQSPYFWLSLARVRQCAKSLNKFEQLAEAASAFHFSDQAHMSREIKCWFGVTPNQLKNDAELLSTLNEPGYA